MCIQEQIHCRGHVSKKVSLLPKTLAGAWTSVSRKLWVMYPKNVSFVTTCLGAQRMCILESHNVSKQISSSVQVMMNCVYPKTYLLRRCGEAARFHVKHKLYLLLVATLVGYCVFSKQLVCWNSASCSVPIIMYLCSS